MCTSVIWGQACDIRYVVASNSTDNFGCWISSGIRQLGIANRGDCHFKFQNLSRDAKVTRIYGEDSCTVNMMA